MIDPIEEERPVVYISFFSWLNCDPIDEYVEVMSLSMIPDEDGDISFSVDLPFETYDVVASSQGFVPDTESDITLDISNNLRNVSLEL